LRKKIRRIMTLKMPTSKVNVRVRITVRVRVKVRVKRSEGS
jgi:hypothetical protein